MNLSFAKAVDRYLGIATFALLVLGVGGFLAIKLLL